MLSPSCLFPAVNQQVMVGLHVGWVLYSQPHFNPFIASATWVYNSAIVAFHFF